MALQVEFLVHSVNVIPVSATVQLNGQDVQAVVDGCEIEFVASNGKHGSFTARWTGSDCQEARNRFKAGETVTWAL